MIAPKLRLPAANKRLKTIDDNMVPLINIVFLLLIFFMVSARISAISGANIEPPLTANEKQDRVEISDAVVEIKSRDSIYFQSEKTSTAQLALDLKEGGVSSVAVRGDKTLPAEDLDAVLKVLRDSGVKTIVLLAKKRAVTQ